MSDDFLARWRHHHTFGTGEQTRAEVRTRVVIALTIVMMVAEIAAGALFGSMALLADGFHMGTHAAALGIAAFAYAYARKHAGDPRYSFGTGKVGALGGFASAVGLAVVAVLVLATSVERLASPTHIHFDEAIAVAVVGLVVNLVSALLLREDHDHHHDHDPRDAAHDEHDHHHHHDHNLRGAYFHVLADALTSILAIVALSAGKWQGWTWMDPIMGVVGSIVIGRWSMALLRDTSAVLLDAEVDPRRCAQIRAAVEAEGDGRVADLHVWRVGPRHLAVILVVVGSAPREAEEYRRCLARFPDLAHVTVEVHRVGGQESTGS